MQNKLENLKIFPLHRVSLSGHRIRYPRFGNLLVLLFNVQHSKLNYKFIQFLVVNNSDEERRFMYDCHPQPSHQLPFDQGVQINIYPKFSGLC